MSEELKMPRPSDAEIITLLCEAAAYLPGGTDSCYYRESEELEKSIYKAVASLQVAPSAHALLEERYWCGCVRHARWTRCAQHGTLAHDEEPQRRKAAPLADGHLNAADDVVEIAAEINRLLAAPPVPNFTKQDAELLEMTAEHAADWGFPELHDDLVRLAVRLPRVAAPLPASPAAPPPFDQVRHNAERDPSYCPYCLRCSGLVRMRKVETMYWRCAKCGAEHDLRNPASLPASAEQPK